MLTDLWRRASLSVMLRVEGRRMEERMMVGRRVERGVEVRMVRRV